MANLLEPDWITLSETARRAAQAFGAELSAVGPALVAAYHDGKIRTRGRCRSYFNNDELHELARLTWDRAGVVWQVNEFAIPSSQFGRKIHVFEDVAVYRDDLERWINGAVPGSHHGPQEPAETLAPKTPSEEKISRSKRKHDVETDAKLRCRIEMVLAKARTEWPNESERPGIRPMAKHLEDNHGKELDFDFETIRQILRGTYPASERLGIRGL